eukprot:2449294-Rhodomonas_salina.3
MEDLGYKQEQRIVFWEPEDNMACIYMSQTSVMNHKARHIDTRVYHLCQLCKEGVMVLRLEKLEVASESAEQVADSLTKSMPGPKQTFKKHLKATGMMGLQSAGSDPKPAALVPAPAPGTNAEGIERDDDDDDEAGLLAHALEFQDLFDAPVSHMPNTIRSDDSSENTRD